MALNTICKLLPPKFIYLALRFPLSSRLMCRIASLTSSFSYLIDTLHMRSHIELSFSLPLCPQTSSCRLSPLEINVEIEFCGQGVYRDQHLLMERWRGDEMRIRIEKRENFVMMQAQQRVHIPISVFPGWVMLCISTSSITECVLSSEGCILLDEPALCNWAKHKCGTIS